MRKTPVRSAIPLILMGLALALIILSSIHPLLLWTSSGPYR